ncbi:hypothetical protein DBR43_10070 [Pedobacter sp. KBW06]|nr:hypothetical protein DBR43_10070 [Pedobacter sp. KBW06]
MENPEKFGKFCKNSGHKKSPVISWGYSLKQGYWEIIKGDLFSELTLLLMVSLKVNLWESVIVQIFSTSI